MLKYHEYNHFMIMYICFLNLLASVSKSGDHFGDYGPVCCRLHARQGLMDRSARQSAMRGVRLVFQWRCGLWRDLIERGYSLLRMRDNHYEYKFGAASPQDMKEY